MISSNMDTATVEEVKIDEKIEKKIDEPGKYNVIFINDNVTPMEWVIDVLQRIFHHSLETAKNLTLIVHEKGSAVVGTYSYEIAEQKAIEANGSSREHGFPLAVKVEQQ
jgi:ATP-dependent Clp protease adaptor protein ClpS